MRLVPRRRIAPLEPETARDHPLRWVLRYSFTSRGLIGAIVLVTLVVSALGALAPIPLKIAVDNAIGGDPLPSWLESVTPDEPADLVVWAAVALAVVSIASAALGGLLNWLWAAAGMRSVRALMVDTFDRLQNRSLAYHHRHGTGESIDRIVTDGWVGYTVMQAVLVEPVTRLIGISIIALAAFRLDAVLSVVLAVVVPVVVVVGRRLAERIRTRTDVSRAADAGFAAVVHRSVESVPLARAFGGEPAMLRRYAAASAETISAATRAARSRNLATAAPTIVYALGLAVVMVVGGWRTQRGDMTLGALLAFLAYAEQVRLGVSALLGVHQTVKASESSIDRLLDVFEGSDTIADPVDPVRPAQPITGRIELSDVWFSYGDESPVLRGTSLLVEPGETVAIVGSSGTGKSTLISLLPRLLDATRGTVRLYGHDVRDLPLELVRRSVAVVRQSPLLLPTTIAANIAFARPDATRDEIEQAARTAQAADFIEQLPDGYDTIVGERGATLSGGQRQRIAIARALVADAPIIVLDEATAGLDVATERRVVDALRTIASDRAVIVVAHSPGAIVHADRILRLDDGRLRPTTDDDVVEAVR